MFVDLHITNLHLIYTEEGPTPEQSDNEGPDSDLKRAHKHIRAGAKESVNILLQHGSIMPEEADSMRKMFEDKGMELLHMRLRGDVPRKAYFFDKKKKSQIKGQKKKKEKKKEKKAHTLPHTHTHTQHPKSPLTTKGWTAHTKSFARAHATQPAFSSMEA